MKHAKRIRMSRRIGRVLLLMAVVGMTVGCGRNRQRVNPIEQNRFEEALTGKWAYIHDKETVVADFEVDGSAVFENEHYTYTSDDQFIYLKKQDGESMKLRYEMDQKTGDCMYVYIQSTYTRQTGVSTDGVVGVWKEETKNWMFEFTGKNTFMEDESMTGYYEVDEAAGTIKLMYGEALEDTVFFFQITDDKMFVEYPWMMVRM